jgi:hypothetical protein
VFPLAGDLFLGAMEGGILSLGPNLLRDYYSDMLGCYRLGECPAKTVQGSLYAIDLILRKILDLNLHKDAGQKAKDGIRLSFIPGDLPSNSGDVTHYLGFARQCLQDAVAEVLKQGSGTLVRCFIDFVVDHKERMEALLNYWETYHKDPALPGMTQEQYLQGAAPTSKKADYPPLIATIKQLQVRLREETGFSPKGRKELEETIHPLYNAASMYVSQGNSDREAQAYDLAFHRYDKAEAIFEEIKDRTSTAKTLFEKARTSMRMGSDLESAREELHKAVCLVVAHMKNMPRGKVPDLSHDAVVKFLEHKGYFVEAEIYKAPGHLFE